MVELTTFASSALPALAQSALKSSLIIVFAAGANQLLRRRTAALRHLVWTAALASVVFITIAGPALPAWKIVPVPTRLAALLSPGEVSQPPAELNTVTVPIATTPRSSSGDSQRVSVHSNSAAPRIAASSTSTVAKPVSDSVSASSVSKPPQRSIASRIRGTSWPLIMIAVWIVGGVLLAARYAISGIRLRGLLLCSRRVLAQEWLALEDHVSSALRIARPVTLLSSDGVDVPITCGVVYPRVVLPASAEEWTPARRHAVLSHELAHVKRFDAMTQWIAFVAAIVGWFNPLVWYAIRQMRFERERACDDFVLASGARASEYATDLLAIVSSFGNGGEKYRVALAMARRSQFEGRLLALLNPSLDHKFLSRGALAVTAILALATVIPVASAHMIQQPAPPAQPATVASPDQVEALPTPDAAEAPPAPEANDSDDDADPATTASTPAPAAATRPNMPAASPAPAASALPALAPHAAIARMPAPAAQANTAPTPPASPNPSTTPAPAAPSAHMFSSGMFAPCNDANQRNISRHEDDGSKRWEVTVRGNDCRIDMRAEGTVKFKPDFSGVESISSGGYLTVKTVIRGETNELDVRPGSGSLSYTFTRNGSRTQMDAAAQKWLGDFLIELDRSSAFAVDTRLPQLLAQGGAGRVLQETAQMSDYARSVYIAALMKAAQLSTTDAREVVRQAGATSSDYYSAQMLMAIAEKYSLDDPNIGPAFVAAIDHLNSDYYHAQVLTRFLDAAHNISRQQADVLLRSATHIGSDYYIAQVLQKMAEKRLVAQDAWPTYLEAAQKIHSDYYRAEVLRILMQSYSGDPSLVARSILAAEQIGSDYYKLEVLRSAKDRFKIEGGVRDAYVKVARTIQSETYRNQALAGLVSSGVL